MAASSVARGWCADPNGGPRGRDLALDPEIECKSSMSAILSRGGTKTVDAEPDPERVLFELSMDWIVRMEPVGERVMDRSGRDVMLRSRASLHRTSQKVRNKLQKKGNKLTR
jgi:hypothetical protein